MRGGEMTTEIAGLPFWELTFDADGHPDRAKLDTFLDEIPARGLTDLVVFSHGWNSDRAVSTRLYDRFVGVLAGQLDQVPAGRPVSVGLAGVFWPARRWSDEPIPDFAPPAALAVGGGGGAASVEPAAGAPPAETIAAAQPSVDAATLDGLRETFPAGAAALGRMAELLESEPTAAALEEFVERMREFSAAVASGTDDGEDDREGRDDGTAPPAMLADEPEVLFERFVTALRTSGVPVEEPAGAGGEAGLTDRLRSAWKGAKEALRQLTYWQMKNRAGVVGRVGLGPALGQLHQAAGDVRIHLVGHSFGARLVSYALAGLPAGLEPSPVRSVTLLQGAFSHFAFADPLPLNSDRKGALAGMLRRVNGPLTVCFSEHDD